MKRQRDGRSRWTMPTAAWLATAFAVAIPTLAYAGHETADVAQYTGCLNKPGSPSRVAIGTKPQAACAPGQPQLHLSGGDITDIETPTSGGLEGGSTNGSATLGLQPSYRLPQACSGGEVAKWNGSAWACAGDDNTSHDGSDFATSGQSCPAGRFITGIDPNGTLVCDTPTAPSLSVAKVDASEDVPFANGNIAVAKCPDGYKLVGGGWGTRNSITDGADVYDWDGGSNAYDVGAGGLPGDGTVYARAYCIKVS